MAEEGKYVPSGWPALCSNLSLMLLKSGNTSFPEECYYTTLVHRCSSTH